MKGFRVCRGKKKDYCTFKYALDDNKVNAIKEGMLDSPLGQEGEEIWVEELQLERCKCGKLFDPDDGIECLKCQDLRLEAEQENGN